jgi:hypothetical protein
MGKTLHAGTDEDFNIGGSGQEIGGADGKGAHRQGTDCGGKRGLNHHAKRGGPGA